jgi:hypothetical protein
MSLKDDIGKVFFSNKEKILRQQLLQSNYVDAMASIREFVPVRKNKHFRELTSMSIDLFVRRMIAWANKEPGLVAEYDTDKKDWDQRPSTDGASCAFPNCEATENIQRDHAIPKFLNKYNDFEFIPNPYINFIPLCPFHNRAKTNSILIGLIFLLQEGDDE